MNQVNQIQGDEMHVDEGVLAAGIVPRIYTFHGVQVTFPFEAYQSQQEMMSEILYHAIRGQNLMTESVAGTGKTLALLCSLLAYQEHHASLGQNIEKDTQPQTNPPLIIYATKTLAHIKHIIGQLALTQYVNTPMGILSSVKNTCNNEESDEHLCDYIPEDLAWLDHLNGQPIQAWDLEDLKEFCRKNETCAYHELKSTINNAKIIFCTYNYLLHPGIRHAVNIHLEGNILVFDEGHNVEDLCRDIASTPKLFFTLTKITQMTEILQRALASPQLQDGVRNHVRNLATTFQGFRDYLNNQLAALVASGRSRANVSFEALLQDLTLVGLGPNHLQQLQTDVSNLNEIVLGINLQGQFPEFRTKVQVMRYLSNALILLSTLWDGHPNEFLNTNSYVVRLCQPTRLVEPDEEDAEGIEYQLDDIELKLICMNPAVTFKCTTDAHSVIMASGTLSPLASSTLELGIPFATQLSANHVVPQEHVFAAAIERHSAESNLLLELNFTSWRDNRQKYHNQLGRIIEDICLVPHGILVFMPTKRRIEKLIASWRESGHYNIIKNLKQVFIEPNQGDQDALHAFVQEYKIQAETETGAILFAVMRGKLSEGIEFRDNHARALVTIGIPFAPIKDLSLEAKREYQEQRAGSNGDILGDWEWYCSNAFKALNQAIGRSIRHPQDWGAILLIDSRFRNKYENYLPNWVTNFLARDERGNSSRSMVDIVPELNAFVTRHV